MRYFCSDYERYKEEVHALTAESIVALTAGV